MDRTMQLAGIAITIVVTGLEDDKDGEEEGKYAEEEGRKDRFVIQNRAAFNVAAR